MRLRVLLPSLLCMVAVVSSSAVPRSANFQLENTHEDTTDQIDKRINTPPFADTQHSDRSDSNTRPLSPGRSIGRSQIKDPNEEFVALCEAGFVSGCREAIERGRKASSTPEEESESPPMDLLGSAYAKLNLCSENERRITGALESCSLSLMVVSAAVVCTVVIARGLCKRPAVSQDSKLSIS